MVCVCVLLVCVCVCVYTYPEAAQGVVSAVCFFPVASVNQSLELH